MLMNSNGLLDVIAGLFEFGYELSCVVMAAGFEVQLDAADLEGVFKVQTIMEDVKNVGFFLGDDAHEPPQGSGHVQKIHFDPEQPSHLDRPGFLKIFQLEERLQIRGGGINSSSAQEQRAGSERSQLARADFYSKGLAGRGDLHFL